MKTLILGDIHGRVIWDDIIASESPDRVIFLGDYVSTHENISPEQQLYNLDDILTYKEDSIKEVILLRGNHDMQHLGYSWAQCSGYDKNVCKYMIETKNRFLNNSQWIYIDEELKTVFSHAGISQIWMTNSGISDIHEINNLTPSELFGFIPSDIFDNCGYSKTQPPTWIRPTTLSTCNIMGWDQVVGHTPVKKITNIKESTKNKQNIWLCDALQYNEYLIIENGKFSPKKYKTF